MYFHTFNAVLEAEEFQVYGALRHARRRTVAVGFQNLVPMDSFPVPIALVQVCDHFIVDAL